MTTTLAPTVRAQQHAADAWRLAQIEPRFHAYLGNWTVTEADDGHPLITTTATGRLAASALHHLASRHPFVLDAGDTHPTLDPHHPDTAIAWRQNGVWIRITAGDAR